MAKFQLSPAHQAAPELGQRGAPRYVAKSIPPAAGDELQAAVRLKVLLGNDRQIAIVTGIGDRDGNTALAARLAVGLASIDPERILLIEGDSRDRGMESYLGVSEGPGLAGILEGQAALEDALSATPLANLSFLPLGASERPLSVLLNGPSGASTFANLRRSFRWILIHGGVVTATPEGILLGNYSDGAVLALALGRRRQYEVTEFTKNLAQFGIKLLGAVLVKEHR